MQKRIIRHILLLTLLLVGSASVLASPRTLPQKQAAHFCQLLVNDGEDSVYPISLYAKHLTTMLCDSTSYGDYTAEQVLTGILFYYKDWVQDSLLLAAHPESRMLVSELHSGGTLRVFPHQEKDKTIWYAPTDQLPETLDKEHQRYIQEVFLRLNEEVQAERWENVDAFIDKMIRYQCEFGSTKTNHKPSKYLIPGVFIAILALIILSLAFTLRKKNK